MRVFLLAVFVLLGAIFSTSYAQTDILSVQSGNWSDVSTWDCGCVPESSDGEIRIQSGHTVTVISASSIAADEVVIEAEANLVVNGLMTVDSSGTVDDIVFEDPNFFETFDYGTLTVGSGGVLENKGIITSYTFSLTIQDGGEYQHNENEGTVPDATWDTGSTCTITGYIGPELPPDTSLPSNLGQNFYNFTWNCPGQLSSVAINGALTTVDGDLKIVDTGGNVLILGYNNVSPSTTTMSVGDSVVISSDARVVMSSAGTFTLNVGSALVMSSSQSCTFSGLSTVTINTVDYTQTSGTVSLCSGSSGTCTMNVEGDFTFSGGTLRRTQGTASINFNGTDETQIFTGGGTFTATSSNIIAFTVASGTTLDLGTSTLGNTSAGTFTCSGSVLLGSTSASGAIQGNIACPTGNRTFNSGSTITYDGAAAQVIGSAHPTTSGVNAIVDNANGVSLTADVTIGGDLTLQNGDLSVGTRTLTLSGDLTANSNNILVGSNSSLVINGSGDLGTFPFASGAHTISAFTLNRASGNVTFANDITITNATTLTNGTLTFSGQTLTLDGTLPSGSGSLLSDENATLTIGGTGALGELVFSSSGNTLNTLNFDRQTSGTGSIDNSLTITTEFNLLNGDFTNTSGLALGDGAVLTRNSTAQLLGSNISMATDEYYSVVYTGTTLTTGIEMPTTAEDDLLDLTISGGPVSLDKNIIVNGDVSLTNSTFNANGFEIDMAGSAGNWIKTSGAFTAGAGIFIISGNTTITASSTPQFGSIRVESGATLTNPSGLINLSGSLELDASSTFNNNSGTVVFNGTSDQGLSGGGKTFNNINVNKSSGELQITGPASVLGILNVQTATTVASDGNLTLLSLSDAATDNGSIAELPSGASITGDVTTQRYMSDEGRIYRYISSTVSDATVADLQDDFYITGTFTGADTGCSGCSSNPSMYYWDETQSGDLTVGYVSYPSASNTEALEVGRGYAAFIRDDIITGNVTIDLVGTVNQAGTDGISLPVTYTSTGNSTADGYNLVGNPLPSTVDWDFTASNTWTKTNISGTIAVRDNGTGGFVYWDGSTGGLSNGLIASGQAFWVRATASSPVLTIFEGAKTSTTGAFFREEQPEVDVLQFVLSDGDFTDKAYYRFREEASDLMDDFDAIKLNNSSFDLSTLSEDGVAMAINAVHEVTCDDPIQLQIKDMEAGSYTLSANLLGGFTAYHLVLIDNFKATYVDFSDVSEYQFEVNNEEGSYAAGRFQAVLSRYSDDLENVLQVSAEEVTLCGDDTYALEVTNVLSGSNYWVEVNGEKVYDSIYFGQQNDIEFDIASSILQVGENNITIKGYDLCAATSSETQMVISYQELYTPEVLSSARCGRGVVTLEATGVPEDDSFNWYESATSDTPIEEQHASTFTTPELKKTKTYYVSAVNSLGCESERVEAVATLNLMDSVVISDAEGVLYTNYETGNQWYLNGISIENAIAQYYTPVQSGEYSVIVTSDEGCTTESASRQFVSASVDEESVSFFPNPVQKILTLRTSQKIKQAQLMTSQGLQAGSMTLQEEGGEVVGYLDMSGHAAGVYILKVMAGNSRVMTFKVIKN